MSRNEIEGIHDPNKKWWHYEDVSDDTKLCPKCGEDAMKARMSSIVMTSYPPQQRWYWECGECGYHELGGVHAHKR